MNDAKIQFSEEELLLAKNGEWILTKNKIIAKISDLFSIIANEMKKDLSAISLPQEIAQTTPKISKGENYKGLPYVVLDYPRLFTKENVFAIRVLFWWGNYFSVTLHLKGNYKEIFLVNIKKNLPLFSKNDFYINTTANEWQHTLHENDYALLKETDILQLEKNFKENNLLKLTAKVELKQWNHSRELIMKLFKIIIEGLKN
ncbi:MAG: hypothetical protein JST75_13885 [Bacteroidetes bacterium]|nr:hypothetical protein [Bacteroidota bacterium]